MSLQEGKLIEITHLCNVNAQSIKNMIDFLDIFNVRCNWQRYSYRTRQEAHITIGKGLLEGKLKLKIEVEMQGVFFLGVPSLIPMLAYAYEGVGEQVAN